MSIQDVLDNKRQWEIATGDCLDLLRTIPDGSVQCVVTSPPYYGLRDYKADGQIGMEQSHVEFIAKLTAVFLEVRRVLRDDGTLWLNIGDSYASGKGTCHNPGGGVTSLGAHLKEHNAHQLDRGNKSTLAKVGLKPKDLIGIPWRLAFALQDSGWYLRSEIIWHKPSAMPESVKDRPSKSHEQIFLLAKSERYFYDHIAVRVPAKQASIDRAGASWNFGGGKSANNSDRNDNERQFNPLPKFGGNKAAGYGTRIHSGKEWNPTMAGGAIGIENRKNTDANGDPYMTANLRTVWSVSNSGFKGEHYATYPLELVEPMIKAGTSKYGCCAECGKPWERQIESSSDWADRKAAGEAMRSGLEGDAAHGKGMFEPLTPTAERFVKTCKCATDEVRPGIVLDPFSGMATTGIVALRLGRRYIGLELNEKYAEESRNRLIDDAPLFNAVNE